MVSTEGYIKIIESSPLPSLLLKPDAPQYTIITPNNAYLQLTNNHLTDLEGKGIFEAFVDGREANKTNDIKHLSASLEKVIETRQPDKMPVQPCYLPVKEQGRLNERFYAIENIPMVDGYGNIVAIIHTLTDVTHKMLLSATQQPFLLHQLEEKNTILASIGDAFFAVDKTWVVTYWNKQAEKTFSTPQHKIIGKNLWHFFAISPEAGIVQKLQEAKATNQPVHFEGNFDTLSAHQYYSISAYPSDTGISVFCRKFTQTTDGPINGCLPAIQTPLLTCVIDSSEDAIISKTLNGVINSWNHAAEKIFGYPKTEAIGKHISLIIPSNLGNEELQIANKIKRGEPVKHYETQRLKKDGSVVDVSLTVSPIMDTDGNMIAVSTIIRDLSHSKNQLQQMVKVQNNLQSLINNTADMIWSVSNDLKIIMANKAYNSTFYSPANELTVEDDDAIPSSLDEETRARWLEYYKRAIAGENFEVEEFIMQPLTGTLCCYLISYSPIINTQGQITGFTCFSKNITDLKNVHAKLIELNKEILKKSEKLAISNTDLEQFAYIASHDLQEPLRMVASFLNQLEKKYGDVLDEKGKQYINFAVDGAKRMRQIILDLLEFSRVGKGNAEREDIDIHEVINQIKIFFKKTIEEKKAVINVAPLPVIYNYKAPLRQVFQNLISNALHYCAKDTPPNITIACRQLGQHWEFSVADKGIGISKEFFDKIFLIFQRLHNKEEYSGTGLGLAVTKKTIEHLGGQIWVESTEGKGSTFYFTIPK